MGEEGGGFPLPKMHEMRSALWHWKDSALHKRTRPLDPRGEQYPSELPDGLDLSAFSWLQKRHRAAQNSLLATLNVRRGQNDQGVKGEEF